MHLLTSLQVEQNISPHWCLCLGLMAILITRKQRSHLYFLSHSDNRGCLSLPVIFLFMSNEAFLWSTFRVTYIAYSGILTFLTVRRHAHIPLRLTRVSVPVLVCFKVFAEISFNYQILFYKIICRYKHC